MINSIILLSNNVKCVCMSSMWTFQSFLHVADFQPLFASPVCTWNPRDFHRNWITDIWLSGYMYKQQVNVCSLTNFASNFNALRMCLRYTIQVAKVVEKHFNFKINCILTIGSSCSNKLSIYVNIEHQSIIQERVTYKMQCIVNKSFEIAIIKAVVSVARRTMENQFIGKSFCYVPIELKSSVV